MKKSDTRWLEAQKAVARLNELEEALRELFKAQSNNNSNSGAARFFNLLNDPVVMAHCKFLKFVLKDFNEFNATYQTKDIFIT